ncbi:MAG: hypothetical protein VXA40_15325, partial [Gammaproteobacteria bacterium]
MFHKVLLLSGVLLFALTGVFSDFRQSASAQGSQRDEASTAPLEVSRYLWEEEDQSAEETGEGPSARFARYLWDEGQPGLREQLIDRDAQPFVGDAWTADESQLLARYLWEEGQSRPVQVEMDTVDQPYLG